MPSSTNSSRCNSRIIVLVVIVVVASVVIIAVEVDAVVE